MKSTNYFDKNDKNIKYDHSMDNSDLFFFYLYALYRKNYIGQ